MLKFAVGPWGEALYRSYHEESDAKPPPAARREGERRKRNSSTASSSSRSPRSGAATTIVPPSPILSRSSVDSHRGGSIPRETQLESGHSTLRRNGSVTVLAGPHQNSSNGHAPHHQRIHSGALSSRYQSPPSPQHGYDNMIAATAQASTSSPHHLSRPSSSVDYQQKRKSLTQPLPNGSAVVNPPLPQKPVAFPVGASTIASSSPAGRTNQPVWNRQRFGNATLTNNNNNGEIRMAPAGSRASFQAIGNFQTLGFTPAPTRVSPKLLSNGSPRNSIASHSSTSTGPATNGFASSGYGSNGYTNGYAANGFPNGYRPNSVMQEEGLVTVKVRPDAQGRYGFNVKGGIDHDHPVIVSRVASGSPADRCSPRLNEGDQVVMINNRDCTAMPHDMVVKVIRAARDVGGGELCLTIKPNVYRCGDVDEPENSANRETPEARHVAETVPQSDLLSQSLVILKNLSESELKSDFAALYRKRPGLTMDASRLPNNLHKNRYRDVCPYDATRVKLLTSSTGDYINASAINMEIPSSGIVNRYIACQGPLPHTSGDFWLMVWEQLCQTIVMLTTLVENGRTKCHEYWPKPGESIPFGKLVVTNLSEREKEYCTYREFSIRHQQSREERRVTQMQYTAWPDHGVPEKPSDFIDFVDEVRSARAGSVDPIVVHCSAGIGRTGVLILMETAACLVEANQPIYPLDIMKTMRDQRATLVQTETQYVFVCQAIMKAYEDGLIKPLAEYQSSR
ncbi:hypothetical protein QR680_014559 [Steinernema hermaphroditum]|uniref:Tyrosine-protein phosphatase n=1 Tax=Steinernema hermaphroditum TaxID=289476 RepID=A0AA39I9A1_9BILA|nr:hypothetical protein QR680_014559 [Steinernema hermaphroditum]